MSRILNFKINSISLSQFHIGSYRLFNFIDSKTFYYYYIWILDFGPNFFSRDLFYRIFYCDLYFRLDFKTIQNTNGTRNNYIYSNFFQFISIEISIY